MLKIWTAVNGYIVEDSTPVSSRTMIYTDLDELLNGLLQYFEGRSASSGGKFYGKVIIERGKDERQ